MERLKLLEFVPQFVTHISAPNAWCTDQYSVLTGAQICSKRVALYCHLIAPSIMCTARNNQGIGPISLFSSIYFDISMCQHGTRNANQTYVLNVENPHISIAFSSYLNNIPRNSFNNIPDRH